MSLSNSIESRKWRLQGKLARMLAPVLSRRVRTSLDIERDTERHGDGNASYVIDPAGLGPESIVYSCGVGNDVSFDRSLIARHGVQVFAFDPTPESARFLSAQQIPSNYRFFPWAVAGDDGQLVLHTMRPSRSAHYRPGTLLAFDNGKREQIAVEACRLATIMPRLGHSRIDLLKLDVEGAEYAVLDDLLASDLDVRQIVLEFHPHLLNVEHHALMIGRTGWQRTAESIAALRRHGYRVFHVSARGADFSFLKT